MSRSLKSRTAGSLKWNLIDRISTQVLYAITGIVLARELSQDDFGLVGAMLIFQAFAALAVDSGFSYALIQRKHNTRLGYSTVLWFNLAVATLLYGALYAAAPLIADCFSHDQRLIPLSRVQFIVLILNASAIVQVNRLMKAMEVRLVAVANSIGLVGGGMAGIALALTGYGAWAIVWQSIVTAAIKSIVLWTATGWRPLWRFSPRALASYFSIGSKMMLTSLLNTIFLNLYSFVIGNRAGLTQLGYYTQSDKWSKMGITSITQVLTSAFLPALSAVQDQAERFRAVASKTNRFTSYILFPATLGLMALAEPIFHTLFGTKWDPSIILFQILLLRGVFTVLCSLYNNYLLALGHGTAILKLEIVRDTVAIIALAASLPWITLSTPERPVLGLETVLYGQLAASMLTWAASLLTTIRLMHVRLSGFIADMFPYAAQTLLIIPIILFIGSYIDLAWLKLTVEAAMALMLYIGINSILGSKIQNEVIGAILHRKPQE